MAGFLPGVPLARRRKIHSHENTLVSSSYNRFVRRTSSASSLPGEAIEARTRLDQKLSCLRLSKNGSVGAEITRTGCSVGRKWWQRGISGKKDFVREEEICAVCLEGTQIKRGEAEEESNFSSLVPTGITPSAFFHGFEVIPSVPAAEPLLKNEYCVVCTD